MKTSMKLLGAIVLGLIAFVYFALPAPDFDPFIREAQHLLRVADNFIN